MKKILLIATGGTIASRKAENGLVPEIPMDQLLNYVPQIQQLIARFTISGDTNTFLSGREVIYLKAWELFLENPILGTGWYTFPELTSGLLAVDIDAHNIFLQLLCETGIVGFSIFMIWFIVNLYKTIRLLCDSRRRKRDYT
ncbi:MAG: O-antigen ligase family protein, partial [Lachnospiraceae bacterium]|nr:O-antigen ligase family protein [Lachnospiraceae bacterium]